MPDFSSCFICMYKKIDVVLDWSLIFDGLMAGIWPQIRFLPGFWWCCLNSDLFYCLCVLFFSIAANDISGNVYTDFFFLRLLKGIFPLLPLHLHLPLIVFLDEVLWWIVSVILLIVRSPTPDSKEYLLFIVLSLV